MSHKPNQKGFSAVEGLLIAIIVLLIGFIGYYVWHTQHQTNAIDNAAAKVAESPSNGGKGGNAGPQTGPAKTEAFVIPEWKLQAEIPTPPESAALIQYQIDSSAQPVVARFTTQELIDLDKDNCSTSNAPAGLIIKAAGSDEFLNDDGTDSGQTVAQTFAARPIMPYKVVSSEYYWYSPPQASCNVTTQGKQLQAAAIAQVKAIVSHLAQEQ